MSKYAVSVVTEEELTQDGLPRSLRLLCLQNTNHHHRFYVARDFFEKVAEQGLSQVLEGTQQAQFTTTFFFGDDKPLMSVVETEADFGDEGGNQQVYVGKLEGYNIFCYGDANMLAALTGPEIEEGRLGGFRLTDEELEDVLEQVRAL